MLSQVIKVNKYSIVCTEALFLFEVKDEGLMPKP